MRKRETYKNGGGKSQDRKRKRIRDRIEESEMKDIYQTKRDRSRKGRGR